MDRGHGRRKNETVDLWAARRLGARRTGQSHSRTIDTLRPTARARPQEKSNNEAATCGGSADVMDLAPSNSGRPRPPRRRRWRPPLAPAPPYYAHAVWSEPTVFDPGPIRSLSQRTGRARRISYPPRRHRLVRERRSGHRLHVRNGGSSSAKAALADDRQPAVRERRSWENWASWAFMAYQHTWKVMAGRPVLCREPLIIIDAPVDVYSTETTNTLPHSGSLWLNCGFLRI
jgi:hypothetical protein